MASLKPTALDTCFDWLLAAGRQLPFLCLTVLSACPTTPPAGRYPKRRYTMLWRQLIALLLGMEELHVNDERSLLVDARLSTEKYIKKRPGTGKTYNCESMFTTDVHELPNTRNTMRPKSRGACSWCCSCRACQSSLAVIL